jgi:hypothetical protein
MESNLVREAWCAAVATATEKARVKFPALIDSIDLATQLTLAGEVTLNQDGSATVGSQTTEGVTYTVHGQRCSCPRGTYAPAVLCKHTLAVLITRKALKETKGRVAEVVNAEALETGHKAPNLESSLDLAPSVAERQGTPTIAEAFIYEVHGVKAVLFNGLLHLAHERGLRSLAVDVVSVSEAFAVMRATVTFKDGLTWSDIGDACPVNVGPRIKPHFIRMASTRAMARCLRNALDIPYVCTVELSDEEGA